MGGVAFLDTNVLVAASVLEHPHYERSSARLALLKDSRRSCSAHTLAEAYNTLTRYPKGYDVRTADAWRLVAHLTAEFELVSLTADELAAVIRDAALAGVAGARVYDALILACARKIEAEAVYTFNVRHFRQIAPDLASRIVQP